MKKFFTHDDPVLSVHHPRVLVETAVAHGADRRALLEGTGITDEILAQPEARISYAQFNVLEGNALRLTKNPALGLEFGREQVIFTVVIETAASGRPFFAGLAPRKKSPSALVRGGKLVASVPGESPQVPAAPPKANPPVTAQAQELART